MKQYFWINNSPNDIFFSAIGADGSPTLIYYRNGIPLDIHTGKKSLEKLEDFVDEMISGKDEF